MILLFTCELKKILSGPALWVFVGLCIVFNMWSIPTGLNGDFDTTTKFPTNLFGGYNTNEIAESYINTFKLTDRVAESMRIKYDSLQNIVDEKAIAGDSFAPYFGESTYFMHQSLFHGIAGIMGRLLLQGILLVTLLALLGIGYEKIHNTEHSIYASKTGRRIIYYKVAAIITSGIALYVLLIIITLAAYFIIFDYGNVWSSSISSGFNYIDDLIGARPFTTWQRFTVVSYMWASLGISLGLLICFSFMGIIIGILSRDFYIGFLMSIIINAVFIALPSVLPMNFYPRYTLYQTPIWLWLNSGLWFTDGGIFALWQNFETWGLLISLLISLVLCITAIKRFEKRDII